MLILLTGLPAKQNGYEVSVCLPGAGLFKDNAQRCIGIVPKSRLRAENRGNPHRIRPGAGVFHHLKLGKLRSVRKNPTCTSLAVQKSYWHFEVITAAVLGSGIAAITLSLTFTTPLHRFTREKRPSWGLPVLLWHGFTKQIN